jgi:hypothetical protein
MIVVLVRILLKGFFGVRDTLQIAIPVVQVREAAEKYQALVPVV